MESIGIHTPISPPMSPSTKRMWHNAEDSPELQPYSEWEGEVIRREECRSFYHGIVSVNDSGAVARFRVGDDALVKAPRDSLPYVARIEALFENDRESADGGKMACLLKWYYRSSEVTREKYKSYSPSEVFAADYVDENAIESIIKKAHVLPHKLYLSEGGEAYDDVFFCRDSFSPTTGKFRDVVEERSTLNHSAAIDELARRRNERAYQLPKIGTGHQCDVPPLPVAAYQPPCLVEEEHLYSPACMGDRLRGDKQLAVTEFLEESANLMPGSKGANLEMALMALHECKGDVVRARARIESISNEGFVCTSSGSRKWVGVSNACVAAGGDREANDRGVGSAHTVGRAARRKVVEPELARVGSPESDASVPSGSAGVGSRRGASYQELDEGGGLTRSRCVLWEKSPKKLDRHPPTQGAKRTQSPQVLNQQVLIINQQDEVGAPRREEEASPISRAATPEVSALITDTENGGRSCEAESLLTGGLPPLGQDESSGAAVAVLSKSLSSSLMECGAKARDTPPVPSQDLKSPESEVHKEGINQQAARRRKRFKDGKAPGNLLVHDELWMTKKAKVEAKAHVEQEVAEEGTRVTRGQGLGEGQKAAEGHKGKKHNVSESADTSLACRARLMGDRGMDPALKRVGGAFEGIGEGSMRSSVRSKETEGAVNAKAVVASVGEARITCGGRVRVEAVPQQTTDESASSSSSSSTAASTRRASADAGARTSPCIQDSRLGNAGVRRNAGAAEKTGPNQDEETLTTSTRKTDIEKGGGRGLVSDAAGDRCKRAAIDKLSSKSSKANKSDGFSSGRELERGVRKLVKKINPRPDHASRSHTLKQVSPLKQFNTFPDSASWGGKIYKIGDCVRLDAGGSGNQDFIAAILGISWKGTEAMIACRWYYFLCDVPKAHRVLDLGTSRRNLEVQEKEVMASTWIDINSIESVKGPCRVLHESEYSRLNQKARQDPQTFFFRRVYSPTQQSCVSAGPDWHVKNLTVPKGINRPA